MKYSLIVREEIVRSYHLFLRCSFASLVSLPFASQKKESAPKNLTKKSKEKNDYVSQKG